MIIFAVFAPHAGAAGKLIDKMTAKKKNDGEKKEDKKGLYCSAGDQNISARQN